jgi:DNA-binding Lrp family transcriptional regulator
MDTLDRQILGELSLQCRVSFTSLAEKFEVSLTTIKNRVEALVEEGVILNFVVQLPLSVFNADFAIISLDIVSNIESDDLMSLGNHPFIMALGIGYELQGFAIVIYRTNNELRQAIDHLQTSELIRHAQAFPVIGPPVPIDTSQTKGLDSLKKIDWKILKSLQWDGRKTLGDIAKDVGVSVPTVRKRLVFMREHNLIEQTIQINPAATERRLVVMLMVRGSQITQLEHFELERILHGKFLENYWISFRMANQPEIMLTFVIDTPSQVASIRNELESIFEDVEIFRQMIVPQWLYFPDFRNDIIDEHLRESSIR